MKPRALPLPVHLWRLALYTLICTTFALSSMFGAFAQHANASRADVLLADGGGSSKGAASALLLGNVPDASQIASFSLVGTGFTPGGKVYIAIYDQAGQVLYANRTINASKPLSAYEAGILNNRGSQDAKPSKGGVIHATFNNLCGAFAMLRAEDLATGRWSGFLDVVPKCPVSNAATIANDLNTTLRLPVAKSITGRVNANIELPKQPVLLRAAANGDPSDTVTVSGLGFTAGHKVYVAVYDKLGAKLYPYRWITVEPTYAVEGSNSSASAETPRIIRLAKGTFHLSFSHLGGANVMIRAYDQTTETWSNWIDADQTCHMTVTHGCGSPDEH